MASILNSAIAANGGIASSAVASNRSLSGLPANDMKHLQSSASMHIFTPQLLLRQRKQRRLTSANFVRCSSATLGAPETENISLYAVLGIERDVGLSEIKSAYRQMARRYHPDVCPAANRASCTEMFLQVQEAYEVLSDPDLRADYDCRLLHPFCAQALGKGFSPARMRRRQRGDGQTDSSVAWKLQWEAQLSRMQQRPVEGESWGERLRRQNLNRNFQ